MTQPIPMVEIWRGTILESLHHGHCVVCNSEGDIVEAWGDPDKIILPRSSCKMLQALPLVESGAAQARDLTSQHLALACASHQGAHIHTDRVKAWLDHLGLSESDLRCGVQNPADKPAREALILNHQSASQLHNNCSGKHSGFLTLSQYLNAGPEYHERDHPVQKAALDAFEDMTGLEAQGYGIDGCSAPNFATTMTGLARAMAKMARPRKMDTRGTASVALTQAMITHPDLVAGEGRACSELMAATMGQAAIKTGAEAVFVAILPQQGLGVAIKIEDGGTRASEAAVAGVLCKYGLLDPAHPAAQKRMVGPLKNWRGVETGRLRFSDRFLAM